MPFNFIYKSILLGAVCYLSACTYTNIRQEFYQGRACAEIKYQCLPPVKPDTNESKNSSTYLKMPTAYSEIALMLEVYYPGFWDGVTDEKVKLDWIQKVHKKAKKYGENPLLRGEIEDMANICAIVGVDFDTNPKFTFIVNKMQYEKSLPLEKKSIAGAFRSIHDYLRFEVLHEDYNEVGVHYNNWSLRDVMDHMPPITRPIPDFYKETKIQDHSKNLYAKYQKMLKEKYK